MSLLSAGITLGFNVPELTGDLGKEFKELRKILPTLGDAAPDNGADAAKVGKFDDGKKKAAAQRLLGRSNRIGGTFAPRVTKQAAKAVPSQVLEKVASTIEAGVKAGNSRAEAAAVAVYKRCFAGACENVAQSKRGDFRTVK